ncbi:restriction endonuclease subunit S [Enterococcus gallinarum]|uniref:restriction endonuclease subunit S n=1 Tax=Enterococcus gallinarum TaxID=1353 RepID=UPI003D6C0000
MSNDTQPEIRFPGFTEDWEQRKLGEVVKINGRIGFRGYTQADIIRKEDGGILAFSPTNIINNKLDFNVKNTYITKDKYYESPEIMVKNGDILFVKTGSTLGKSASVSNLNEEATINPQIVILRATSYFISEFISSYLISNNILKQVAQTRIGGAVPTLTETEIKRFQISAPKGKEQQKIGTLFKQLDDTIALHQRKLDLLKETKKGFLQKMFPKNGAKVPEIRFPGFTEDWEERRLQEVVDRYDNLRIPITASKRVAGNTPYYGANGIQGYVEGYTHDGEFILVAEDGANDLKNYPVQYVDGKVWVNNHAHVIQAKENLADNMFLMNAIRSINIEPFLVGGGRAKLNADVLMKLEVIIPLKSEQQKIGNFFKQLDDTITLHQRKLDLLKETKKGFLQKMFV